MSGFVDWLENLAGQLEEIADTRTEKEYLGDEDSGGEPEWMSDPSKAPNDRLFWAQMWDGRKRAAWRTGGDVNFPWIIDGSYSPDGAPNQMPDSSVRVIHEIIPE